MDVHRFGQEMIKLLPEMIRGFARHESNYFSKGKITLPQLWALEYLYRTKGCPMNELANSLGISRPAATGLIDRLIAQGLVRRIGDSSDRRVVRVNMTPTGARIIDNIWKQKQRTIVSVFGQISAKDRVQYLNTLKQVAQILKRKEPVRLSTSSPRTVHK